MLGTGNVQECPEFPQPTTMLSKRDTYNDTILAMVISAIIFAIVGAIGLSVTLYRRRFHNRLMKMRRQLESKNREKYVQLDEERRNSAQDVRVADHSVTVIAAAQVDDVQAPIRDIHGALSPQSESESEAKSYMEIEPLGGRGSGRRFPAEQEEGLPGVDGLSLPGVYGHGHFLPPPSLAFCGLKRRPSLSSSRSFYNDEDEYDGWTGQPYNRSRSPSSGRTVSSRSASMLGPR